MSSSTKFELILIFSLSANVQKPHKGDGQNNRQMEEQTDKTIHMFH